MLNVYWEVDGRRVTAEQIEDEMMAALLEDITEQARDAVGEMTCPEHGTTPELTVKYKEDSTVDFECNCCCESFSGAVQVKLDEFLGGDETDESEEED